MSKSIRLSPKHGVNPSVSCCHACGNEYGVILFGALKGDAEAPRNVALGLCENCEKVVRTGGVILIECRDGSKESPYRTGRLWGITGEAFSRVFAVPYSPVCFIDESTAKAIGLGIPEEREGVADAKA
jgi:hypothetical protein